MGKRAKVTAGAYYHHAFGRYFCELEHILSLSLAETVVLSGAIASGATLHAAQTADLAGFDALGLIVC